MQYQTITYSEVEKYNLQDAKDRIDMMHPPVKILDVTIRASRVLELCDPIALQTYLNDIQEYKYECDLCCDRYDSKDEVLNCECRKGEDYEN